MNVPVSRRTENLLGALLQKGVTAIKTDSDALAAQPAQQTSRVDSRFHVGAVQRRKELPACRPPQHELNFLEGFRHLAREKPRPIVISTSNNSSAIEPIQGFSLCSA